MNPRYAQPGSTIVVKGTITNDTGGPLYGVQVQLETGSSFGTRSQLDLYEKGTGTFSGGYAIQGALWPATGTLHNGSTLTWSASFTSTAAGFSGFGVYPIVAQPLANGYYPVATAHTLLPYWPGSRSSAPEKKLDISWLWPLIDQPQQGACSQTLASNDLQSSLSSGGRLNNLLTAGQKYAASTQLTWAVDPALLSDVQTMSTRYKVGPGNNTCTETKAMPASTAAGTWLNTLRSATANGQMFITPYADPDVSALTHSGQDSSLTEYYQLGASKAAEALPGTSFGTNGGGIAWPAEGAAGASVLTSLARDGVETTVLSSSQMPLRSGAQFLGDDAVTRVPTGVGNPMNVLLADSQISGMLGEARTSSSAGEQFAVTQDFLAETAMILDEAPNSQRSVVIAPPRRWDPSQAEATELLQLTSTTPWLSPVSLSSLASGPADPEHLESLPENSEAPGQLSASYMNHVKAVQQEAALYLSLLYRPSTQETETVNAAVAATVSTVWRGTESSGKQALRKLQDYLSDRLKQVKIISGSKVLLGGTSGSMAVSVSNGLTVPVQVTVQVTVPAGSSMSIGDFNPLITVPANQTVSVRVPVHSAALGSTQIQLQLVAKDGLPLPVPSKSISVESTRYGRALLVLIAAALGVLLLTSVVRWTRRRRRPAGPGGAGGARDGDDVTGGRNEDSASGDRAIGASASGRGSTGSGWPRAAGRSGGTG